MLKPNTLRLLLNRINYNRLNIRLYCIKNEVKYEDIPISNIRNFGIIAHIDHGKSTLADRLLEITGTLNLQDGKTQILDSLQVEQERGITVKAVTASLRYKSKITNEEYLLNLVDTPGHVDFCNEVSRALLACQSVILLVDANQGVQAQTVANFYLAFMKELTIIPVLNKIDLKNADPERVEKQLYNLFEIQSKDVLRISAKLGTGVEELLETIVTSTPCPNSNRDKKFKGLLFDNWFDRYKGVVIILYVKDGSVKEGDTIISNHTGMKYTVKQVGILKPNEVETQILKAGQIGYISCNMRSVAEAQIGDTFYKKDEPVEPFPPVKTAQPMVFAGVYPMDPSQHVALGSAIEKLVLTDSAVSVVVENSPALGQGWRLGFLGLLHMEVFSQRLDQEYDAQAVMTTPSVTYKIKISGDKNIKRYKTDELLITNPLDLPDPSIITEMYEPMVLGTIIMPESYMGTVLNLCMEKRGVQKSTSYVDSSRIMMQFVLPLNEIIVDFYDTLKSVTSGFASFDYEDFGYQLSDLVKMDLLLNGNVVDELCVIVPKCNAVYSARRVCEKLTTIIPRQQFKIAIQAAIGSKILARENIKPYRKDVTSKCYGGDVTRKMKLLRSQAEGKKKMRKIGNIDVPRDTFIQLLKR